MEQSQEQVKSTKYSQRKEQQGSRSRLGHPKVCLYIP